MIQAWVTKLAMGRSDRLWPERDRRWKRPCEDEVLRVGNVWIDPSRFEIRRDEHVVALSPSELKIVLILAQRAGETVRCEDLLDACHEGFADVTVRSVSRRVQRLRKKLGPLGDLLVSVHGVGYTLKVSAGQAPPRKSDRYRRFSIIVALLGWSGARSPEARASSFSAKGWLGVGVGACATAGLLTLSTRWAPEPVQPVRAALIGVGEIPPLVTMSASDGDTPHFQDSSLGGIGSGIEYLPHTGTLLAIADAGPENRGEPSVARYHELTLAIDEEAVRPVAMKVQNTVRLRDERGHQLVGEKDAGSTRSGDAGTRLDAESIRVTPMNSLLVADEYGPSILEFDRGGHLLRRWPVPSRFVPSYSEGTRALSRSTKITGRATDSGFVGLTFSSDLRRIYAIVQRPLVQDTAEAGRYLRLLEHDIGSSDVREYVYALDEPGNVVTELLACGENQLLVFEQDDRFGPIARCRRVYRVSLTSATNVADHEALQDGDRENPEPPILTADKEVFLDLLEHRYALPNGWLYWSIEGMSWGPDRHDGRRTLLLSTDNQSLPYTPTYLVALAVDLTR